MRILFVAMPQSIHAARWINQVSSSDWDVHVFPCFPGAPNKELRNVTMYGVPARRPAEAHSSVRWRGLWPLRRAGNIVGWKVKPFFPPALAWLVRALRPDVVHSLEIQHAGYLTLAARRRLDDFPPWTVTNWGSDIFLFGRLESHREKIREVLASCDYYACECHRDVDLARQFGFRGQVFPVLPNTGGLDLERMSRLRAPGPTSARRLVMLKGYQGWAGRALVGLRAIELCADVLRGYTVAVYLASPEVEIAAELARQSTGVQIEIIPYTSHEEILRLHGRARASIGLSISDAASISALEAMAMGSFPLQSNTSCLAEWISDGDTGLLVHPDDPASVASALRRALGDDRLVDEAAEANAKVAAERLDAGKLQHQILATYERMASEAAHRGAEREPASSAVS